MKILVVEEPNKEPVKWTLSNFMRRRLKEQYQIEESDIEYMIEGNTIFRNDVAFSIEDK